MSARLTHPTSNIEQVPAGAATCTDGKRYMTRPLSGQTSNTLHACSQSDSNKNTDAEIPTTSGNTVNSILSLKEHRRGTNECTSKRSRQTQT